MMNIAEIAKITSAENKMHVFDWSYYLRYLALPIGQGFLIVSYISAADRNEFPGQAGLDSANLRNL